MRSSDPTFQLLFKLFGQGQTISVPRVLVGMVGDLKTAILLSQIAYWTEKLTDGEEWFYKTTDEWETELTLTRHEIERSTAQLESFGFLETKICKVKGIPKKHYKLAIPVFREWICEKGEVHLRNNGSPGLAKKRESTFSASNTTEEYVQKSTNTILPDFQETENQEPSSSNREDDSQTIPPPPSATDNPPVPMWCTPIQPDRTAKYIGTRLKSAGLKKLGVANRREIASILSRLDPKVAMEEEILAGVDRFIENGYWLSARNPLAVFFAFFKPFAKEVGEDSQRPPAQPPKPSPTPTATQEPQPVLAPPSAELPNWIERWNAAGLPPVVYWNGRSPKAKLAEAQNESEFVDGFEAILKHCKAMNAVGRFKVPDFNWLFITSKEKQINWYRLLHGEFEFAESKAEATNRHEKTAAESLAEEIAQRRALRQQGEAIST